MESSEQEKRITALEADVRAIEDALDSAIADRKRLREDLDTAIKALIRLAQKFTSLADTVDRLETSVINLEGEAPPSGCDA
jgi:predicted nuclease with TOPRIM domain